MLPYLECDLCQAWRSTRCPNTGLVSDHAVLQALEAVPVGVSPTELMFRWVVGVGSEALCREDRVGDRGGAKSRKWRGRVSHAVETGTKDYSRGFRRESST